MSPEPVLVGGRYRLDHRIAVGGMGEVWQADDTVLHRAVAVKLLKPEYAGDDAFRHRFLTEARHAAVLEHPGVAQVYDFGDHPDPDDPVGGQHRPYLVMELVRGQPLSDRIGNGRSLPPAEAARVVALAADALQAAHDREIVHRDVKPGNLLLTDTGSVKVTDFGIAKAAGAVPVTATGMVVGTPHYLSPEQASGGDVTTKSDVYSLGVVLYEALAGVRPFDRDSPVATALAHVRDEPPPLPDAVPTGLREITGRAMAKDPGQRPASAEQLAHELRYGPGDPGGVGAAGGAAAAAGAAAGAAGGPATTRTSVLPPPSTADGPPTTGPGGTLPWWRRPAVLAAVVVGLLLLVGGTAFALQGDGSESAAASDPTSAPEPTADPTTEPSPEPSAEPGSEPSPDPTATTEPEPPGVEVIADDYLLQDKDVAEEALEALGLQPETSTLSDDTVLADDDLLTLAQQASPDLDEVVLSVTPEGTLPAGTTVTLGVWKVSDLEAEDPGNSEDPGSQGQGNGSGEEGDDRVTSRGEGGP